MSQAARNETSRNVWRPARPWSIGHKRTSMHLFVTLLLATLASFTGNSTMVLFDFFPYISCIPHGIQLLSSLPPFSPPSPLLLPCSLYPTNHYIGGRAKSEPSKHLSSLNVRQRLIPLWTGASLRSSTAPSSSRT